MFAGARAFGRGIAGDGSEGLGSDLVFRHAQFEERRLDGVHHGRWTADVRPAPGNVLHRREQVRVDAATLARPCFITRIAHRDGDAEVGVASLQLLEFLSKNEIAWRPESKDQRDLARPTRLGEITRHAHHGSDPHARADQDHAFRLFSVEDECPVGSFDFYLVAHLQLVMQPARHQPVRFAFHRDFDSVAPGG